MQLEPLTEQLAQQHNIRPSFAGFKIPYFDFKGRVLPFFRYRFLQSKPSKGWSSLPEPEKPLKYTQPAGTAPDVYIPPLLNHGMTWQQIINDTSSPLIITEGELKAACACSHNIPVLGLGGVWNFQSARLNQTLLPALESIKWADRRVITCYDSDSALSTKADVQQAQYRLAMLLTARGAHVCNIDLPPIDGAKVGLDDYIVAEGVEAFIKLAAAAPEMQHSVELHKLNDEVAYIRSSQEIIELRTGHIMSAEKFANVAYRPRKFLKVTGGKSATVYAAKEWLECEYRHEVNRLTYNPGEPLITAGNEYNLWHPVNISPVKGSIRPWERMVERVLSKAEPAHVHWLKQWFAAPLRWPGVKLHSAVLIWGPQGIGKGVLGVTMKRLYGDNYHLTDDETLFGRFSYWAHRHQFIMVDEIEPRTRFEVSNKLKSLITRDDLTVELKMTAPYTVKDHLNYYFTSNKENAIQLDPDDRRFFVHQASSEKLSKEEAAAYFHWLDEEGGAEHLLHYFVNELNMTGFDIKGDPPNTRAKADLVEAGYSELEYICARLYTDRASELPASVAECHLFTTADILNALDPLESGSKAQHRHKWTSNHLTRCLHKAGFKMVANEYNNVEINGVRERVWALCRETKCERMSGTEASVVYERERPHIAARKKFEAQQAAAAAKAAQQQAQSKPN